jgi:hypothetical protein
MTQAQRPRVLEFSGVLYTIPAQINERKNILYNRAVPNLHHEFWSESSAPNFEHAVKPLTGGRVYVNTNISLRRHPLGLEEDGATLKTLGQKCPLAGKAVVCDGWIERVEKANGEVRFLRVLFATNRPVESATHEMGYPKAAAEAMLDGDVRIPHTLHVVRLTTIRKRAELKSA